MTKDKVQVLFDTDADGYITGWQQEFWDGRQWQTPFDTSGAVELSQAELDSIVLGATKWEGGKLTTDADKVAAMTDPAPQPTAEQQMINELGLQNAKLAEQVTALTKKLGGES